MKNTNIDAITNAGYLLCKTEINWADEINFSFIDLMREDHFQILQDSIKNEKDIEISFGTNKEELYDGEDILKNIKTKKISNETYEEIKDMVDDYGFLAGLLERVIMVDYSE